MTPNRKKRLYQVVWMLSCISVGVFLVLRALKDNIQLYVKPSEFHQMIPGDQLIRVGGLVQPHSVHREGLKVDFTLTDFHQEVRVQYEGVLPALFREGQGLVVTGYRLSDDEIKATEVLAKHDETYRPPKIPMGNAS